MQVHQSGSSSSSSLAEVRPVWEATAILGPKGDLLQVEILELLPNQDNGSVC